MRSDSVFVQVAVPVAFDELLTYRLPREVGPVGRGSRVVVPLGPRLTTGFVVDAAAAAPPVEVRVRDVAERLDPPDRPAVVEDVLSLCEWAADYYITPLGEMLRIALPSSLSERGTRFVRMLREPDDATVLTDTEAALIERVRDREVKLNPRDVPQRTAARALADRGFVEISERVEDMAGVALDRWVIADGTGDALPPKQADVMSILDAMGGEALHSTLVAAGASPSSIGTLSRKNLLRVEKRPRTHALDAFLSPSTPAPDFRLTAEQNASVEAVRASLGQFAPFLLQGVTGSGKTEVYIEAMTAAVEAGRQAILLVPEISLTPAAAARLKQRFGDRIAILHSNLGPGERYEQWRRAREGEVDVAIGPRSALFVPFENLGMIIVDEEHDSAYKQDENPRYNARDLAIVRARFADCPVILGSATPSLESRENAERGRYTRLVLDRRVEARPLPDVEIVDIRKERGEKEDRGMIIFSGVLIERLQKVIDAGEQAMILMNRRGYAPFLLCRECDHQFQCRDCSVTMTVHRRASTIVCHYCGFTLSLPSVCPACNGAVLQPIGYGTEKVEERFRKHFPGVMVETLDRDSTRRKGELVRILDRFRSGDTQVLIGTQMISKGHDFPNVTLTAVINADGILGYPDFRSAEKTFALLTQVAGRAGRGSKRGNVLIQSGFPDHYALTFASQQDYEGFYEAEIEFRKRFRYPPFSSVISILLRGEDRTRVERDSESTGRAIEAALRRLPDVRIQGPTPAPLERLKGVWRYQILVRSSQRNALRAGVREALSRSAARERIVDVDPINLL